VGWLAYHFKDVLLYIMFHVKIKPVSTVNPWLMAHRIEETPATIPSSTYGVTNQPEHQDVIASAIISVSIVDTACNHNIPIRIAPSIISKFIIRRFKTPYMRGKSH